MQTRQLEDEELIKIGEAARILERSTTRVRQFELEGLLKPMWLGGLRFYRREDVERLRKQRELGESE